MGNVGGTAGRERLRADYGLDVPGLVRAFLLGGGTAAAVGSVLLLKGMGLGLIVLGHTLVWPGVSFMLAAGLMIGSSRIGKLRERERLLDCLGLQGEEYLLDVGCGRGLLLVGGASGCTRGEPWGSTSGHKSTWAATPPPWC